MTVYFFPHVSHFMWPTPAIQLHHGYNNFHGLAHSYTNLCLGYFYSNNFDASRYWGHQAITYSEKVGDEKGACEVLENLSRIAIRQRDFATAELLIQRGMKIGFLIAEFHNLLGLLAIEREDFDKAKQEFLVVFQKEISDSLALDALSGTAIILFHQGFQTQAVALLKFIQDHKASKYHVRQFANLRFTSFSSQMDDDFNRAEALSSELSLIDWIHFIKSKIAI